jgi:hypothetical protein
MHKIDDVIFNISEQVQGGQISLLFLLGGEGDSTHAPPPTAAGKSTVLEYATAGVSGDEYCNVIL